MKPSDPRSLSSAGRTLSRREFIAGLSVAGAALPRWTTRAATPGARSAADQVTLGQTGVRLSRLGLGTGSMGGSVQRGLGQDGFTRLVRYAYDQGITYIDTAQNYDTHEMVRRAIAGLPREKLFIQTKMPWGDAEFREKPLQVLDRYRRELGTDYIDSLLIHCTTRNDWHEALKPMMDAFAEAKQRKLIRIKGVSCHGLPALTRATQLDWVDVQLARINPQGHHMDGAQGEWAEPGNFDASMKELRAMHNQGRGMIGMKIIGNGDFKDAEAREKSIRFAMTCGCLDAVVIGFANPAEIDEAVRRINSALAG